MVCYVGLWLGCFLFVVKELEAVVEVSVVEAVAGERASIPCEVPQPLEDDGATLILWYRHDSPNPIYTLDVRNTTLSQARHYPSVENEGRLRFDVGIHPPELIFSTVGKADEAEYKCRVDLRRSRTLILQSRLNVIVPPDEPIIMDEYGQRLRDIIGPYDEGSELKLICDVDGGVAFSTGDPSPSVTWWRDDLLLNGDFNVTTRGFVRNVLILDKIRRTDWNARYSCRTSNSRLSKPQVATVLLDMNLLPLDVTITGHPNPMLAGERYKITCWSSGSRPAAITSWWFSGNKIVSGTSETVDEYENVTVNVVEFVPFSEDNGKVLTCKAANPAMPKSTMQAVVVLNIEFIPILNLTVNGTYQEAELQEGDQVYMECSMKANPWVSDIKWHFEQKPILNNVASGVLISNQSLTLKHARPEHSGKYYCSAENSVDRGKSNTIEIFVKFAPKCKSNEIKTFVLTANETIHVTCDVEAEPDDVNFKWSLETSGGSVILQQWNTSNVFFYSQEHSSGILTCWGRNSVDAQTIPCLFRIITATVPDAPYSCTLGNLTEYSFSLECDPGHNGSLAQSFHLEVYDSLTEMLVNNLTNSSSPDFESSGLSPGTTYVLLVYASNGMGRSNLMTLVTTTLIPAERRTAREIKIYINLILRILLGIVVGFCGMASLICLLLAVRKLRNKNSNGRIIEATSIQNAEKKELDEVLDSTEKGPDIIPQSVDGDVFFMSGKLVEAPKSPKTSPVTHAYRKYKLTHILITKLQLRTVCATVLNRTGKSELMII
ncbi:hypothetical protein JTE90_002777 [Oedothorax gibbosus]|uniref:Nephrin n=1 Tax=Oedothorax gibbosus TaxID=931172 RepID=A0AAV6UIX7_9ARAC|nr:hypothetical protein JTE90_002777 [Oedothorax gibbosus]